jgi:hypothetical protein
LARSSVISALFSSCADNRVDTGKLWEGMGARLIAHQSHCRMDSSDFQKPCGRSAVRAIRGLLHERPIGGGLSGHAQCLDRTAVPLSRPAFVLIAAPPIAGVGRPIPVALSVPLRGNEGTPVTVDRSCEAILLRLAFEKPTATARIVAPGGAALTPETGAPAPIVASRVAAGAGPGGVLGTALSLAATAPALRSRKVRSRYPSPPPLPATSLSLSPLLPASLAAWSDSGRGCLEAVTASISVLIPRCLSSVPTLDADPNGER